MRLNSAAKVGLAILLSLGAFLAVWFFILGQSLRANSYPIEAIFQDAQNITEGAEVRMAGVMVGIVDRISLTPDNQASLALLIRKNQSIPAGSRFVITSGGLIGEKYVSILPRTDVTEQLEPETTVQGQPTVQLEDLMVKAGQLATSADRVIQEARLALTDTRVAIRSMTRLVDDPALQNDYRMTMANIRQASEIAESTAAQFRGVAVDARNITASTRPRVDRMMASMESSAANIEELTGAVTSIVSGSGEDIQSDLGAALHNVRLVTESMIRMSANMEKLTADESLTGELRASLSNLRHATQQTAEATTAINESVQRVTRRLRGRTGTSRETDGEVREERRSLPAHGSVDLLQNVDPGRFRADLNGVLPLGRGFVAGGIRDVGETNRLNLQLGETHGGWTTRYGIMNGFLGVGVDHGFDRPEGYSLNIYRPNSPTVDVYGRKRLRDNNSLLFGVEDLFKNPKPTIGIRLRR